MRSSLWRFRFLPCLLLLAPACAADTALEPPTIPPSLLIGPPGCPTPYLTSGILEPIRADGSSAFQLGRTVPVKVRIFDCVTGEGVNTLAPQIGLALVDLDNGGELVDLVSSSAADDGTTMRSAGDGQYIFNLSTKRSQFAAGGGDLRSGLYELTISSPGDFEDVVVRFTIRP